MGTWTGPYLGTWTGPMFGYLDWSLFESVRAVGMLRIDGPLLWKRH